MNPSMKDVEEARQSIKKVNEWLGYLEDNGLKKPEQYIEDQVITFNAEYGRIGIIWVGKQECTSCKLSKPSVVVDQSEGEYMQAVICFDCINLLRRANL